MDKEKNTRVRRRRSSVLAPLGVALDGKNSGEAPWALPAACDVLNEEGRRRAARTDLL